MFSTQVCEEQLIILFRVLQESDAQCTFGLLVYSLDCLYHAVERHAKASGEWQWSVSIYPSCIFSWNALFVGSYMYYFTWMCARM